VVRRARSTRFTRCSDMSLSIDSRPLMILRLATSATHDVGSTPQGTLTIFPVTGGSFEGERLRGKVLAGGGDWVTAHEDGTFTLDLRVTLEKIGRDTSELQSLAYLVCRLLLEKK